MVSPSTAFALGRLLLTVLGHELILLCANATRDEGLKGCFCACQSEAVWVTLMTSKINTGERSHYFQARLEKITD